MPFTELKNNDEGQWMGGEQARRSPKNGKKTM